MFSFDLRPLFYLALFGLVFGIPSFIYMVAKVVWWCLKHITIT